MPYQVNITQTTQDMLRRIGDRRIRGLLVTRMEQLANEPEKQGDPLSGELDGYRSVRAVDQRYRIIYTIDQGRVIVIVVAAGIRREGDRRDIYSVARRLFQQGLLDVER